MLSHGVLVFSLLLSVAAPDAEAVRQAIVARCGIEVGRVEVERWDEPPGDLVVIKGTAPLSDAQLGCIGQMVSEGETVPYAFEDDALGKRASWVTSRSNLASIGLLDRLPVFDPARDTLGGFAHRLERLCGARRGSLLVVEGDTIRVRDGAFDRPLVPGRRIDPVLCIVAALGASGFDPFGAPPLPVPLPEVTTPAS